MLFSFILFLLVFLFVKFVDALMTQDNVCPSDYLESLVVPEFCTWTYANMLMIPFVRQRAGCKDLCIFLVLFMAGLIFLPNLFLPSLSTSFSHTSSTKQNQCLPSISPRQIKLVKTTQTLFNFASPLSLSWVSATAIIKCPPTFCIIFSLFPP